MPCIDCSTQLGTALIGWWLIVMMHSFPAVGGGLLPAAAKAGHLADQCQPGAGGAHVWGQRRRSVQQLSLQVRSRVQLSY
jgi:hypothetical protein